MSEYVDFEIKPNLPVLGKQYGKLIPRIREEIAKLNQKVNNKICLLFTFCFYAICFFL